MEKTIEAKLTRHEASQIEAAITKYDAALQVLFKQMKKDQADINKLKAETRAMLAGMKNA